MIDGSSWRVAILVAALVLPTAIAAAPSPILTSPSGTEGQPLVDLAMDPSGQYVGAVVVADTAAVNQLPGIPVSQTKPDVYLCDFGAVTSSSSAQSCVAGRHRDEASSTDRLQQSIAVTSYRPAGTSGLTARYAVGGPGDRIGFWSSTEQSARWETTLPGDDPVLNVSISPNGTRLIAVTDAAIGRGSVLYVYDTAGTNGALKWQFNLTNSEGQANGVRVRDMDHSRTGRYLAVGTTPGSNGGSASVIFLDIHADTRPTTPAGRTAVQGSVWDIELSDNGDALVVGTSTSVYYYPLASGLPSSELLPWSRNPSAEGATSVTISGDGTRFAAASGETIHFYRHINDSRVAEEIGQGYNAGAPVSDLAYDRTGRLLVAIAGNKVFGFAANQTSPIWSFDATSPATGALDGPLTKVAVNDGGERFVVAGRTKIMPYATSAAATLAPVTSGTIEARPGSTVRVDYRITNTGSLEDEFQFRATVPVGWPSASAPAHVALLPDASAVVSLNVTVPEGHQPGTFRVTLDAHAASLRNASRESRVASADVDLRVPRAVALTIEPGEERFEIPKGNAFTLPVTIRNTGNAGGLVNLSADQSLSRGSPWSLVYERDQVEIGAGNEVTVNLVIDAPTDGASGDRNLITLVAREGAYEVERVVTAYIEPEFGVELSYGNETGSLEFTGRAPQTISIAVRNSGNTDDAYNLTHEISGSAVNDWTVTISRPQIDVQRGQTRNVGITVTPNVAEPRAASLVIRAVSQNSLDAEEGSVAINLVYRAPDPEEDDGSFIPGPSTALVVAFVALAALGARLRGGRRQ